MQNVDDIQETRDSVERDRMYPPHTGRELGIRDQWIEDELRRLSQEVTELRKIKLRKGQPVIYFVSAAEVLKAVDSRVADRTEARKILGLSKRKQPPTLAAAARARASVRKTRP